MPDPIRILLVDDHPLMLMGIRSMLEGKSGIEVVGTAPEGEQALKKAAALKPDVMMLDIIMPGMDGIELARRMRAEMPDVALLVLSSDTSIATLETLLNIGIDGFLPKTSDEGTMLDAIRSVAAGYEYFGTDIARLIDRIDDPAQTDENARRDLAQKARNRILSAYTWETIAGRYGELWRELEQGR